METKLICRECAADSGMIPADTEGDTPEEPRREDFETFDEWKNAIGAFWTCSECGADPRRG